MDNYSSIECKYEAINTIKFIRVKANDNLLRLCGAHTFNEADDKNISIFVLCFRRKICKQTIAKRCLVCLMTLYNMKLSSGYRQRVKVYSTMII